MPTDQIVFADDADEYAREGFGGMQFAGHEDGRAVTCAIKPTVHPTADVPIVLADCQRVIKIEPKS